MSIISFVILDVLYSLSTLQRYKQSALRKKELIAFFGEYFNENTICIVKVRDLFHNLYMSDRTVLKGALPKKQL